MVKKEKINNHETRISRLEGKVNVLLALVSAGLAANVAILSIMILKM